ncbi:MAG: phosphatase PAP2 family protein [Gammaproteobacteria bacterium]
MVNRCFVPALGWAVACLLSLFPGPGRAAGLDHRVTEDTSGLYSLQDAVPVSLALLAAGCAWWRGTEERLGKTCWEAGESALGSAVAAEAVQFITGRRAPSASADPNQWFRGGKGSFPSTHVAVTTAAVTPFIYQYIHDEPLVAVLALLPMYEMVARVKAREHWQTDVIAGAALGFAVGAYEAHRDNPLVFSLLPGGAYVGYHHSF